MTAKKKANEPTKEVSGRALVDIPQVGAKSGDYITLPADLAAALTEDGSFDPKAVKPAE